MIGTIFTAPLLMIAMMGDKAERPPLPDNWDDIEYVKAQKDPRFTFISGMNGLTSQPTCKVRREGRQQSVALTVAFLVDDKGAIKSVEVKPDGCEELEKKVKSTSRTDFKGVIQPAPAGEMAWYQTEVVQAWE